MVEDTLWNFNLKRIIKDAQTKLVKPQFESSPILNKSTFNQFKYDIETSDKNWLLENKNYLEEEFIVALS